MTTKVMQFSRCPQTDVLIEIFSETSPGLVPSAHVAKEVRARLGVDDLKWRDRMTVVKKALLEDHKIRVEFDRAAGQFRHLTDAEAVAWLEKDRRGIGRKAKRMVRNAVFGIKDRAALNAQQKMQVDTATTIAAFMANAASRDGSRLIADMSKAGNAKLTAGQVVDLFKRKKTF